VPVSEPSGVTITDGPCRSTSGAADDEALARLQRIADPTTGIITGLRRVPVPPGEPGIQNYVVERADFAPLTDGNAMAHEEGGCAFSESDARIAAYGEAVERYCGCVFRRAQFHRSSYAELADPAVDPTAVVNFSATQRASMAENRLCGPDDELSWVAGENLASGATTYVPAQLVYLSYPPESEPFIRNPVSTGLAAGTSRAMAVHNGLAEVVERDAFITYYLTRTELPVIDLGTAPPRIRRLVDRVTAHGLELTVLDATTDLGVPVAIAVLVDRASRPAVTAAAAAGMDATAVIESALEEVVQTRLWTIQHLETTARDPAAVTPEEITDYEDRGLLWAAHDRISDLDFWVESHRETTVDAFRASGTPDRNIVDRVTGSGYDCYAVDVTTRDISALGLTVQKVVAPRLQPLYLVERLRYFGGDRLTWTPVEMGYRDEPPTEADLHTVPHPFP
jgi:ribosomal protein S12 methylthiotransferase accessory factor